MGVLLDDSGTYYEWRMEVVADGSASLFVFLILRVGRRRRRRWRLSLSRGDPELLSTYMNNAYACTTRTSISPGKKWDSHECKLASGGKLMLLSKELIVNVVVNWQCLSRAWINSWRVLQQPVLFGVRIFNVQINIFCSSRIKPFFFSSNRDWAFLRRRFSDFE